MQIAIDEILIKDGRRELDKSHVHELAESIRELGLLNPITIDQENVLIAGPPLICGGMPNMPTVQPAIR